MPGLSGITGNAILQQIVIYQIVGALVGAALGPYLTAVTNAVQSATPLLPLDPGSLANAVVRGELTEAQAADQAKASGIDPTRFHVLYRLAGDAPAPDALAVALRRGLIDHDRYLVGVRQGRLRDEWADLIQQLSVAQPSPQAALDALLEGQVDDATARDLFAKFGGDPTYFQMLFDTQGSAPTPGEAATLALRGIIPWDGTGPNVVSFQQAFLEGPWRNKWQQPYRALAEYLPPPRTITAMYKEGSLTRAQAVDLLQKQGLTAELAAAYVQSGSSQKTQPTKDLAQSTVTTLYRERLIDRPTATSMLESLDYDATEADWILQIVDVQVVQQYLNSAIGRVHTLYTGHKISRATAISVLGQLQVPESGIPDIVGVWDYERAANVVNLTPAQVVAAYKAQLFDQSTAQDKLVQLGYVPHDAWVLLSLGVKQALPDEPPADAVGPAPGA